MTEIMLMTEDEHNKTYDPDFKPTELSKLISKYKQIVKLAKNNREQYPCHNGIVKFMSNKNQREASVLYWLMFLEEKLSLEKILEEKQLLEK